MDYEVSSKIILSVFSPYYASRLSSSPCRCLKKKSAEWTPTQALCKTLSEVCDKWLMEQCKSYCSSGETRGQSQHTEDDATEEGKTSGP